MGQILALVVAVAIVAIGWRIYAARQRQQRAAAAALRRSRNSYHCVEVRKGEDACTAVEALGHVRFLSDQAPRLPVTGCTVQRCACGFIHYDDRREEDRRHPYGRLSSVPPVISGERRARYERRKAQENTFRPSIAG